MPQGSILTTSIVTTPGRPADSSHHVQRGAQSPRPETSPRYSKSVDQRRTGKSVGYRAQRQANASVVNMVRRVQIFIRFPRGRNVELAMNYLGEVGDARSPRLHRPSGRRQKTERVLGGEILSCEQKDRPTLPRIVALVIGLHPGPQERRQHVASSPSTWPSSASVPGACTISNAEASGDRSTPAAVGQKCERQISAPRAS